MSFFLKQTEARKAVGNYKKKKNVLGTMSWIIKTVYFIYFYFFLVGQMSCSICVGLFGTKSVAIIFEEFLYDICIINK